MKHSTIAGSSTAKRVIACHGSVALCAKMPPKPPTIYSNRGTLRHSAMEVIVGEDAAPESVLGMEYEGEVLDQEALDEDILPALAQLDKVDPNREMELAVETPVEFGKYLPGVFGTGDLFGRIGNRAIVLDWKFTFDMINAEENDQLMFLAAAGMRTPAVQWVFDGATEIELVIIRRGDISRWVTTPARIAKFEKTLKRAVKISKQPDAKLQHGDHCRWCAAKPICPLMTGAVDRALVTQLAGLDKVMIGKYLANAEILEGWISDLRALAMQSMENGQPVPGWKLVAKRGIRKWTNEQAAAHWLDEQGVCPTKPLEVVSPAQAEKLLKPLKKELPDGLAVSVSSGNTFAPESDPRPAIVQIGQQLTAALSKIV